MKNTDNQIFFNFSYFALNLLGKNLYSTPLSAISELVANGLDAQASNVKLYINMEDKEHSVIEILDNGTGMTYSDLANKYVFMGKNKREELSEELKQSVMGRKGIGKLSALFLSKKYYIVTKTKEEDISAWCLDTIHTNESETPSLQRCDLNDIEIATQKYFKNFKSGTLILLPDVNLVGIGTQSLEGLKANLSDYFLTNSIDCNIEVCVTNKQTKELHFEVVQKSIAYKNMCAFIDITKEDSSKNLANFVRYTKSKYDEVKNKKRDVIKINPSEFPELSGEHEFTLEDRHTKINIPYKVEGWIGIHSSIEPSFATDNDERFIRNKVYTPAKLRLYIRKKLAVENFMELMGRTQAFDNYIEGEISFDILDDDRLEDIATTNRQNLKPDDERVRLLVKLLNPILGRLIKERIKFGNQISLEEESIEAEIKRKQEVEKHKAEEKAELERKAREEAEHKRKEEEIKRKQAEEVAKKAAEDAKKAEAAREAAEEEAKNEKQRSKFIESNLNEDQENFAKRLHMLKINISTMNKAIKKMVMLFQRDKFDKNAIWTNLKTFSYHIARAMAALKYSPYAKFNTQNESINDDLFAFIREYAETVLVEAKDIKIKVYNKNNEKFVKKFSPQDIVIILENIASNTAKPEHNADLLEIEMFLENDIANIIFKNNGKQIDKNINTDELFDFGKSYTKLGTGIGLYHVKKIVEDNLQGSITINRPKSGFELQIRI